VCVEEVRRKERRKIIVENGKEGKTVKRHFSSFSFKRLLKIYVNRCD